MRALNILPDIALTPAQEKAAAALDKPQMVTGAKPRMVVGATPQQRPG
jgi:hypothetical protein